MHHSNPGGMSGISGISGISGHSGCDAPDGVDGTFYIRVYNFIIKKRKKKHYPNILITFIINCKTKLFINLLCTDDGLEQYNCDLSFTLRFRSSF